MTIETKEQQQVRGMDVHSPVTVNFRSVSEHDIDMVLGLSLTCAVGFSEWLYSRLFEEGSAVLLSVSHGVIGTQGESDVEVLFETPDGEVVAVLIENKINAQFQPKQLSRYIERGEGLKATGQCSDFRCVLLAPKKYLGDKELLSQFTFVSYEDVRDWLSTQRDPYAHHGAHLIDHAIGKKTGTVGSEIVTTFWRLYHALAKEKAPELQMALPELRPATSAFVFFSPNLPKDVKLRHKMPQGHVDLVFYRQADCIDQFEAEFSSMLEHGMSIVRAGGSIIVRLEVGRLNLLTAFESQRGTMEEALEAAQRHLKWWKSVSPSRWPLKKSVGQEATAIDNAKARRIQWVESDERLDYMGHGVQFLCGDERHHHTVAFLDGFGWRNGGAATVRLAKSRPTEIAEERWPEITASAREAVRLFLSDDDNLNCSFHHGQIHILING